MLWLNKSEANGVCKTTALPTTVFPGDHSRLDPPDPISNSEVKHSRADDSVGFPHVKVGHCQDFITESGFLAAFFLSSNRQTKKLLLLQFYF